MLNNFPKFFTSKAISLYFAALIISNIIFFNHILNYKWWMFGIVEALSFFYYSNEITRKWQKFKEERFLKKVFSTALLIRLSWMIFAYIFYSVLNGNPFEFDSADAKGYHQDGMDIAAMLHSGELAKYFVYMKGRYSDMGYSFFLGGQYFFTGNSIFIARIFKCLLGAYTCIFIYKFSKRNFNEDVARMATIFCMLMPNLILYTGLHTKEVEMLFITVLFMDRADLMLRNRNFNFAEIAPPILLAGSLFFFRTVLGATAIFALFTAILFTPNKILNFGKRIILFIWILGVVVFFVGGTISNEVESVWKSRDNNQQTSMNMRATEVNGNKFAKTITGAIFAPMIFAIPFPTVIETPKQENQKLINGGNYVKNIMAFFLLIGVIFIIKEGKWRDYLLLGTFLIGYLAILTVSAFAQSERFHQPVLPFELIIAAYGISVITNKQKKYYTWWLTLIFLAVVGWSWFKLAGRGMV